ncbi:DNA methyltransferase [Lactobacillus delbrueckii]|nr:DNA methyltransferase [Lactobacillus delbrueckii]MDF4030495.1 DNA methyltransferase [Lactobacillus delbrueckii]
MCNEIFGERNFVECLVWKKRATPPNDKNIGRIHEFILIYAKNIEKIKFGLLPRDKKSLSRYSNPDNDPHGPWVASDLSANGKGGRIVQSCVYPIVNPKNHKEYYPSEGRCWLFNRDKMTQWIKDGRVSFRENTGAPFLKRYLSEVRNGLTLPTIMTEFGYSQTSAAEEDKLFGRKGIFEYAKPTTLLDPIIRVGAPGDDDIILDFFSGSATTAHAIFKLNSENNSHRKFILIQIPELTNRKSTAYKAGFNTICDIGEERIRRAGKKIKEETDADIDYGFCCFKVDSSNMKDVYYAPADVEQLSLDGLEDNIKEDRTPEDLLIQVMLDLGILLSSEIETKVIAGKKIFSVADGYLLACFDKDVTEETVIEIANKKPFYAVFRDNSMANDSVAANFEQIFETYSPETVRKVL